LLRFGREDSFGRENVSVKLQATSADAFGSGVVAVSGVSADADKPVSVRAAAGC
jgi:hypothetical protein